MSTRQYVRLSFACTECDSHGEAPKVAMRPGETPADTAERFQRQTREACRGADCQFTVVSPRPAAEAQDATESADGSGVGSG